MKHSIFFLICTLTVNIGFGQDRFAKVEIKTHPIKENIFMLEGSGGNIGLYVSNDEVLIVDSQFAPLSDKIINAIGDVSDLPIKYLVNTHWHGDHTGGNENFAKEGAIIIGHEYVQKRLSEDNNLGGREVKAAPEMARTDIAFEKEMSLNLSGKNIIVQHVGPAHTDGDAFVFFGDENVLHMGDCFFNGRFPYIDLNSGGSVRGLLKAIEAALMIVDDETVIIPGHGSIASQNDLMNYHKMFKTLTGRMEKALGKTDLLSDIEVDEIIEGYEDWGAGFINGDRIVEILFKGL